MRELAVSNITHYSMISPGNSLKDQQSYLKVATQLPKLKAYDEGPSVPVPRVSLFYRDTVPTMLHVRALQQVGIDRSSFYKQVTKGLDI